jgi:hypothetical protein
MKRITRTHLIKNNAFVFGNAVNRMGIKLVDDMKMRLPRSGNKYEDIN